MKTYTTEEKREYFKQKEETCKKMFNDFFKKADLKSLVKMQIKAECTGYSYCNTVLAFLQAQAQGLNYKGIMNPFYKWRKIKFTKDGKEQATAIKKGMKGLMIWRPQAYYAYRDERGREVYCGKRQREELIKSMKYSADDFEDKMSYQIETTFDICQTNNPEYEELRAREQQAIYGDNVNASWDEILKIVRDNFNGELKINSDDSKLNGCYAPVSNTITINNNDAGTLLHEFSHSQTQHLKEILKNKFKLNTGDVYAVNEIIAEITSFEIYRTLGHDLHQFNYTYSNAWSNHLPDKITISIFKTIYKEIKKTVSALKIGRQASVEQRQAA